MPENFVRCSGLKGFWHTVGELQINFLRSEGLKPRHKLLDVGCGTFRGGRHIIEYLKPGNYYGLDKKGAAIEWGKQRVLKRLVEKKEPHLFVVKLDTEPVDLIQVLGVSSFDFVWMHALLDHLGPLKMEPALHSVRDVLDNGGCIYATSFVLEKNEMTTAWKEMTRTYSYRDPWHYTMEFLEGVIERAELRLDDCPPYKHPLGLTMLKLVRAADE